MLEHFKGDELFVKKVLDYKDQVIYKQKLILTNFLNPHEIDIVRSVIGNSAKVYSYGGFINSESQRIVIASDFYEINNDDFKISVVRIDYNNRFNTLKHRDVLGALMNLGIDRSCIGDIVEDQYLYFACCKQNYSYIKDNLKKIGKLNVNLIEVYDVIEIKREYIIKNFIVSSFRIDKLISVLYGVPRSKVKSYLDAGYVKVNYKQVAQGSYLCNNNDIISLRKHGRVKLVYDNKMTKSNNYVVNGYFYK